MQAETIAAIATALSASGISIIRISGEEAIAIADRIFMTKGNKHILRDVKSHTIHYGFIFKEDEPLDEVMVSVMKSPRSYTAEDTVEINCHGGILITRRILELILEHGARLAEPGEFTKRAFLNGRIDLTKAEAVMDLIRSDSELALRSSFGQLQGSVSSIIKGLRKKILHEIAFIESALDDPEHITLDGYEQTISCMIEEVANEMSKLLHSATNARVIREGIRTVILGKPNAGKSSLLNALSGEERAIVTDIAGTTRDILEESVRLGDVCLRIMDTAGIRFTDDAVEKIGVEKAVASVHDADLILYVADSSIPWDENDSYILSLIGEKNCLILLNKTDLTPVLTKEMILKKITCDIPILSISLKEGKGMENLETAVSHLFFNGKISFDNEVYLTNMRHKEALQEALDSMLMVKESIAMHMPEDFYSIDLMNAYAALGRILGEEVGEDLINEIFSSFCMGK